MSYEIPMKLLKSGENWMDQMPKYKLGCFELRTPNSCKLTTKERHFEADSRMKNDMYFIGHTHHGYQKPIREMVNPNKKDPTTGHPPKHSFLPKKGVVNDFSKLAENFRFIDVYSGLIDGKNYGRFQRLYHHKRRHARNPLGTEERFCIPATSNMDYGWWRRDLKELEYSKNWHLPRERFPQVQGEVTKFFDEMVLHDPNFILF